MLEKRTFNSLHLLLGMSLIAYILLGYGIVRSEFGMLMGLWIVLFSSYGLIYADFKAAKTQQYFVLGIGAAVFFRFCLLFYCPNLSDDFYRFVWDGRLLANGISPFAYLPVDFFNGNYTGPPITGIHEELLGQLNSPKYFTIYPPVCQFSFWFSCLLFPESLYGATVVMKLILFAFECGSLYLIYKLLQAFKMPAHLLFLYALNPLVIVELCGNLHFEAAMIFFTLLSVWWLLQWEQKSSQKSYFYGSAIAIGLGVCAKLIPLIFLPFLILRIGILRSISYFLVVGLTCLICFLPLFDLEIVLHLFSSVELYFQKFEFNASIYYICRRIGYWYIGWNMIEYIGKRLALATFIGIMLLATIEWIRYWLASQKPIFKQQIYQLFPLLLLSLFIYFGLATIVHPWYVTSLIAVGVFTHFRFPVAWSAVVVLSYYTYISNDYIENMYFVALEYIIVYGILLGELYRWWVIKQKTEDLLDRSSA